MKYDEYRVTSGRWRKNSFEERGWIALTEFKMQNKMNNTEIAKTLGASVGSVNSWTSCRRIVPAYIMRFIDLINLFCSMMKAEDPDSDYSAFDVKMLLKDQPECTPIRPTNKNKVKRK